MLLIMLMAAILLISLTAALPSIYTEAQREKEKELIFRGTQYARAIYLFHQQFHRYPTSVKELLHTNDMSFLRRPYPDPMTPIGKWRFIHATASGVIIDSEDIAPPNPLKPGQNPSSQQGNGGTANSSAGSSAGGQGQMQNATGNENPFAQGQPQAPGSPANSNPFAQGQAVGTFIVGVASTSTAPSIEVYNHHAHYNKWEFIGVPGVPGSVVQTPALIPGLTPQAPASSPNPAGSFGPASPATNPAAGGAAAP